jgi:hypothetical protein
MGQLSDSTIALRTALRWKTTGITSSWAGKFSVCRPFDRKKTAGGAWPFSRAFSIPAYFAR